MARNKLGECCQLLFSFLKPLNNCPDVSEVRWSNWASIKKALFRSLMPNKLSNKCLSTTTMPAIKQPVEQAVCLVAWRAKSVTWQSSLTTSGPIPFPSSRSFSRYVCDTGHVAAYALPTNPNVTLQGLVGSVTHLVGNKSSCGGWGERERDASMLTTSKSSEPDMPNTWLSFESQETVMHASECETMASGLSDEN